MYEPDLTAPIWALELIAVLGRVIDFERDQIESVRTASLSFVGTDVSARFLPRSSQPEGAVGCQLEGCQCCRSDCVVFVHTCRLQREEFANANRRPLDTYVVKGWYLLMITLNTR